MYKLHICRHVLSMLGSYLMYSTGYLDYIHFIKNVANHLAEINIFYVKFFQWFAFSIGHKLKNKEIYDFFINFKDNVNYTETDIDYESIYQLMDEVKREHKVITFDSMTPINSGSVALVFKAILNDKPVVVKLLRKNIEIQINEWFEQGHMIINIMRWLRIKNCNHLHKLLDHNKPTITEQCDFVKEVENIERFYNKFRKTKYVIIPKVYREYTIRNPRVIVMDYIQGERLGTFDKNDFIQFQKLCYTFITTCCFFRDICHGDLHTGNIIFVKNTNTNTNKPIYKIGVIDYGICVNLNVIEQNLIANLMRASLQNDKQSVIFHLLNFIMMDNENSTMMKEQRDEIVEHYNSLVAKQNLNSTITHYEVYVLTTMLDSHDIHISQKSSQIIYAAVSLLDTLHELEQTHSTNYPIINILFKNKK